MAKHNELGVEGEKLAQGFLIKKGYTIIASNWRQKNLEIDIICILKNTLCFVEVKTRSSSTILDPVLSVNTKKQKLIIKAAHEFLLKNERFSTKHVQFDIVSIVFKSNNYDIKHIEDAYYPTV